MMKPVTATTGTVAGWPPSVLRDMALGAVAGAAGVWVMDRVGWFMYDYEDRDAVAQELRARRGGDDVEFTPAEASARQDQDQPGTPGKDVAHVAVEKAARLTAATLPTAQPNPAGIAMHYGLGILPWALHAVLRRKVPAVGAGAGALYGAGLFVVNDEIVAPVLGLASGPMQYPWQAHARGLVAHTVLGVVTETVLRAADRAR